MSDLRSHLQAIYDERGRLTPSLVVDVARDPAHALHSRFEWDDTVAGEAYRRQQAHELIQSVRVTYRSDNGSQNTVRAFHAVRSNDGSVYEPLDRIVADPVLTEMVRRDMERAWRDLRTRYEHFDEFWTLVRRDAAA